MAKTKWGYDLGDLNTKVRPQDDFFQYANGGWIKKNPIPENEARWGAFMELRKNTDDQLKSLLSEIKKKKRLTQGSENQIIHDFYLSGIDIRKRNQLASKPVAPFQEEITQANNKNDIVELFSKFERFGVTTPFSIDVSHDLKNTRKYAVYVEQDGLGLPDRDYYLKKDKETLKIKTAYIKYIEKIFKLLGYSESDAKKSAKTVIDLETRLARASMSKVDLRDPHKIYNKVSPKKLKTHVPEIDWDAYFRVLGCKKVPHYILAQPKFMTEVNKLLKRIPISDWKTYLLFHLASDSAPYLSEPFIEAHFDFYGKTLSGSKEIKPLWRRVLNTIDGTVGEALGKLYVKKYFGAEAKRKMNILVDDLFEAYEERIKNLDWMSPTTKEKALHKLSKMGRKIGYPDKWKSYKGLKIKSDDYYGNVLRASEYEHMRQMKKVGKPVDRNEWYMRPHTVNAYYAPTINEIVFPAAILQPPFFDLKADDALNYGSIGAVIGHEITHGFDDEGSKFDANGNLKTWWTKKDREQFDEKTKVLEKQFNKFTVAPGVYVNGKLTLGENIADLGGMVIAYWAYQKKLKRTGRKDLNGFTPEQRFFLGAVQIEKEHARPEFLKMVVKIDPHSPSEFRVNGPVSNLEEFYDAFGVTKKDKLYRPPSQRANIW